MSLPGFSVKNPVLVNMLMILIIVLGIYYAMTVVREMFPNVELDRIAINDVYPGASPEEVEKGIVIRIEDAVTAVDGVDTIRGTAMNSIGSVTVEINEDYDPRDVRDDLEKQVDAIQDFPESAEKVIVSEMEPRLPVIIISISGDVPYERLREKARELHDALLELDGITKIELTGIIPREIVVHVRPGQLRKYRVTLPEIAAAIKGADVDMPGGTLRGKLQESSVRLQDRLEYGRQLEELVLRVYPDGSRLLLGQVAEITDAFTDAVVKSSFNGKRSIGMIVSKYPSEDAVMIADSVKAFIAGVNGEPMPDAHPALGKYIAKSYKAGTKYTLGNLSANLSNDLSKFVRQRLDTMKTNAAWGLALVVITLLLLLHWRVALWTSMGLPVAFLGTFIIMNRFNVTLNMISMFGMIIVLGMIVDDAIIIAENVYRLYEDGMPPREAAVKGTEEVMWPVIGAVATTCAAFLPLMYLQGTIGKLIRVLPIIVIAALSISLIEAMVILPSHLAETMPPLKKSESGTPPPVILQTRLTNWFNKYIYTPLLNFTLVWRYPLLAASVAVFLIVVGYSKATSKVMFAPDIPPDLFTVELECPPGTPLDTTEKYVRRVENLLKKYKYDPKTGKGSIKSITAYSGLLLKMGGHGASSAGLTPNKGTVLVELADGELREMEASEIVEQLRGATAEWTGTETSFVLFKPGTKSGEKEIELKLLGNDLDSLRALSAEIQETLGEFSGTYSVSDDWEAGGPEYRVFLTDYGRSLGLTRAGLAAQVRSAVYGLEAIRIHRNNEEIKVMVRYAPDDRRDAGQLLDMNISLPGGGIVPLRSVAKLAMGESSTVIMREDRKRQVIVGADVVDSTLTEKITSELSKKFIPVWQREFSGVDIEFGGARKDFMDTMVTLVWAALFALFVIYCILAVEFNSFAQPLIVMTAIPFSLIGALLGHKFWGIHLSVMSFIGMAALTGIVVNDSLVMIDFINKNLRKRKMALSDAIIDAARKRLRPILLTSITTIAGLMPLLLEKSMQARIMIPCAVSISFGLMFSTILILVIVPSIYHIYVDISRLLRPLMFWKVSKEQGIPGETAEIEEG